MGRITRAEIDERIAADDGDPDDTVLVMVGSVYSQDRQKGRTYHCSKECGCVYAADQMTEMTRQEAQERGLAPCMRLACHGEASDCGSDLHARLLAADPDEVGGGVT